MAQFILLEIYGLCSGDKRSYEFVEVFHGDLMEVSILSYMIKITSLLKRTIGRTRV
jgi:hypothetical protein